MEEEQSLEIMFAECLVQFVKYEYRYEGSIKPIILENCPIFTEEIQNMVILCMEKQEVYLNDRYDQIVDMVNTADKLQAVARIIINSLYIRLNDPISIFYSFVCVATLGEISYSYGVENAYQLAAKCIEDGIRPCFAEHGLEFFSGIYRTSNSSTPSEN